MARGLKIWNALCQRVGLLMAIPEKRQHGTWVEWLGAGISSVLAVAWVTPHKVLSALVNTDRQCYRRLYHDCRLPLSTGAPGTSGFPQSDEAPNHVLALGALPEEDRFGAQSPRGSIYSDAETTPAMAHSSVD